jgi:N-carbamoylputrescine amidase
LPDTAGIQFWGSSFIAGPQGEILTSLTTRRNPIAEVDLDLQKMYVRTGVLQDRRIDAFATLLRAID